MAGVSVEVAFTSSLRAGQRLRSASSDAAGRIVVPHLRAWSDANVEAVSRFERDHRWRLRVDPYKGSALELRVQTLPAAAAPDRVIALPLADEAVTIDGLPVAKVALEVRVGGDVAPFESYRFEELSTKRQFVGEGRWVEGLYTSELSLWPVRVGHDLSILLRRNALSDRLTAAVNAGDIADDLRARVELGSRAQTWRLRPTRDGAPAANSELRARIRGRRGALRESVVVTDARGELLIDIYPPDRNGRRLVLSERSEAGRARVGVVDLRDERQALIDVALETRAEIQIEIVDDSGAPVAGAEVATFAYGAFDGLEYGSNAPLAPPLKTDELGRAQLFRTDKHYAGVFAWWGRVEVTARGYSMAEASFSERVPDLRLVLDRPAKVLGYLRATDPMDVADINLLLLRREDGAPETQAPGVTLGCSCDGRFEFEELRPTEYTLIVRRIVSFARPVELARREKLVLTNGQVLDLGEIEVR